MRRLTEALRGGVATDQNAGGDDVMVMTKDEFRDQERAYWRTSTPVGFVFGDGFNFKALVILGPGRGALLAGTAPLFTALLAWPVLGEHPGPLVLLGMLLTVGGVIDHSLLSTGWPILFTLRRRSNSAARNSSPAKSSRLITTLE